MASQLKLPQVGQTVQAELGMLRKTSNTGAFSELSVPMQMREVRRVAADAGVGLKGIKVQIIRDPNVIGKGLEGYTPPKGNTIQLYPDAFKSTESLVRTLGHERTHVMQLKLYGPPTTSAELKANETAAYSIEQSFWNFYKGIF